MKHLSLTKGALLAAAIAASLVLAACGNANSSEPSGSSSPKSVGTYSFSVSGQPYSDYDLTLYSDNTFDGTASADSAASANRVAVRSLSRSSQAKLRGTYTKDADGNITFTLTAFNDTPVDSLTDAEKASVIGEITCTQSGRVTEAHTAAKEPIDKSKFSNPKMSSSVTQQQNEATQKWEKITNLSQFKDKIYTVDNSDIFTTGNEMYATLEALMGILEKQGESSGDVAVNSYYRINGTKYQWITLVEVEIDDATKCYKYVHEIDTNDTSLSEDQKNHWIPFVTQINGKTYFGYDDEYFKRADTSTSLFAKWTPDVYEQSAGAREAWEYHNQNYPLSDDEEVITLSSNGTGQYKFANCTHTDDEQTEDSHNPIHKGPWLVSTQTFNFYNNNGILWFTNFDVDDTTKAYLIKESEGKYDGSVNAQFYAVYDGTTIQHITELIEEDNSASIIEKIEGAQEITDEQINSARNSQGN